MRAVLFGISGSAMAHRQSPSPVAAGVCTFGVDNYLEHARNYQNLVLDCDGWGMHAWVNDWEEKVDLHNRDLFYRIRIGGRPLEEEDNQILTNFEERERKSKVEHRAKMLWDGAQLPSIDWCALSGMKKDRRGEASRLDICKSGDGSGCKFVFKCEGVGQKIKAEAKPAPPRPPAPRGEAANGRARSEEKPTTPGGGRNGETDGWAKMHEAFKPPTVGKFEPLISVAAAPAPPPTAGSPPSPAGNSNVLDLIGFD